MKKKLHFLSALLVAMLLIPWQLNAQVLSENFDNLDSGVPTGWVVEGNAGSSYNWQVTGSSYPGYNDTKGLWFNSYYADNGATAILKSPVFSLKDVTKVQMLKVACKMTDTGSKASCKICISTDGGSSYETVLQNISYSADWQEVEISLADYAGKDNLCIVFNNVGGWYGRHIIDNFEIAPAPSCAKAKDLTITGIYQYTATFNWSLVSGQGAPASTYEVKVYEAANDSCVATVSASVSPSTDGVYSYTLEEDYELNPGTAHYFTVQGICGLDEKAAVVKSSTFFTLCDPYEITDSRLNLDLSEWTINPFFPCWATNGVFTNYSTSPSYNNLALDWSSSDEYLYLISPAISHAANDIEVEFEYSSYYASGVTYGVATSADISNFEVLGHIDMKDESGIVIFNTATSQNTQREQFIVLKFDNDEPNIHAITIRKKPCCPKPLSVAVAPIDSASINVSWSGVATKFTVNVYEKGNNVVYKTAEVEGNTATISGLTASTDYAVTIVAACNSCGEGEGSVGYSEMTDSVFVTTLCGVAQNVYLDENFSNSVIPECWMQNKEEVWSINQSGNRIFAFMRGAYIEEGETALLVTQPIAIAADKKGAYDISFEMERRNLSGTTGVGELTVWVNSKASTEGATKIATIERSHKDSPVECAEGWYNYSFNIPAFIEGTVYVIFEGESHGSNSNPISITNVKIVDKPTCREVSEIKIGNPATTSLPISWVAETGQEKWALSYVVKKVDETIVTFDGEVTSVNYTVTGLPSSSDLTIEGTVAAICGEGLRSTAKTFSYSFQTACAPVVLPLEESFENLNKFPPVCWSSENTEGSTSYVWSVNSGSSEKTSDGQGFAYLPSNTTVSKAILSTPELVFEDDKDYRVEFYIYRYAYTSDSYAGAGVNVYLGDSYDDVDGEWLTQVPYCAGHSFDAEENGAWFDQPAIETQTSRMYRIRLDFNTSEITGKHIIFEGVSGYYASFAIDGIWIGPKPEVDAITAFSVDSITANSARVSFSVEETVPAFDVVYGTPGFDPNQATENILTNISGRAIVITGLVDNTEYEVYLRGRNGEKVSSWSKTPMQFRTACLPFVVDETNKFVEGFENYSGSDFGCWTQVASSNYYFEAKASYEYYANSSYLSAAPQEGLQMACIDNTYGSWMFRQVSLKAGKNYAFSAYAKECNENSSVFNLTFALGTEISTYNTKLVTETIAKLGDWQKVTAYFTVPKDTIYYIAIAAESGSTRALIDNVVLEVLDVIPPTVEMTNITASSASFAITSNANAWDMYYSTATFDPESLTAEQLTSLSEKTFTIEGLTSATKYYYALRSKNSESVSAWTKVLSFETPCDAASLPFFENFEGDDFQCWTIDGDVPSSFKWDITTNTSGYVYEGTKAAICKYSSTKGLKTILVTPQFNFEANSDYVVDFYVHRSKKYTTDKKEGIAVYLSDVPYVTENATLFTFVPRLGVESSTELGYQCVYPTDTVTVPDNSIVYQHIEFEFNAAQYPGKYLIFEAVTQYGYYQAMDNLSVKEKVAACEPVTVELNITACSAYTWGEATYTESGDYTYTTVGANGCDSTTILHLTINQPATKEVTETACVSYTWNGQTYTESGDYKYTTTAANGCDSIVTLHLTVNQPVATEETAVASESYTWNGQTYIESGDYTFTTTAANGCDSVVTLHLTILPPAPAAPSIQYPEGGYFASEVLTVAVTTTANNATVLVTIDGTEPTVTNTIQAVQLTSTATVKARTMLMTEEGQPYKTPKGEYIYSDVVSAIFTKVEAPAAPEFTPAEGEYYDSVVVSIACATENVMIKYQFGGTEPMGMSPTYTSPFKLTETTVVSAVAYLSENGVMPLFDVEGLPIASQAKFAQYKVTPYVAPAAPAAPSIQYPEGGYFASEVLTVAVTTTANDAAVLVTIDGTEPTVTNTIQAVQLTSTATVKARTMLMTEEGQPYKTPKGEYIYSDVVSAIFTKVEAPAAPEFTPAEGEYYDSVVVSIACATENVMIKYQFGGTEPMGMSPTYTSPFKLTETTVVSAVAYLSENGVMPLFDVEGLPIASQATFAQYTIKPKQGVGVDNVEVAAIVYAKDGMVYVDTEIGNMIEVFTVQGQRIYAAEATAQLTTIDAYAADVVLVRVNGNTVKVAVR